MKSSSHEVDGCTVRHFRRGVLKNTFDFGTLGLSQGLAGALARALVGQFGHTSVESQRQSWRCLRKFAFFLSSTEVQQAPNLPADVLVRFREWLACGKLAGSTAQSILNVIVATLNWCYRNVPEVLSPGANLIVLGFNRGTPMARQTLTFDEMKAILAACYSEIDEVEARWAVGQRLRANCPANAEEERLAGLVG